MIFNSLYDSDDKMTIHEENKDNEHGDERISVINLKGKIGIYCQHWWWWWFEGW